MSEEVLLLSLLTVAFLYFRRAHLKSPDGSSLDDGRNALQPELYPSLNQNAFVEHRSRTSIRLSDVGVRKTIFQSAIIRVDRR